MYQLSVQRESENISGKHLYYTLKNSKSLMKFIIATARWVKNLELILNDFKKREEQS